MELLKCKATIALIIMILGVAFVGGVDSANLEDHNNEHNISINA